MLARKSDSKLQNIRMPEWSNKFLGMEAKVRIYKIVVRPILAFTAETRTDTAKTREIFEVWEMKSLRRIAGKTRMVRVKNEDIREKCNIQKVNIWVERRRTEWSTHVLPMNEDRLVRKVHDNNPTGKRRRWKDALE